MSKETEQNSINIQKIQHVFSHIQTVILVHFVHPENLQNVFTIISSHLCHPLLALISSLSSFILLSAKSCVMTQREMIHTLTLISSVR